MAQTINDRKIYVRSRSSSVVSNDDQSRCSSIGILRQKDIIHMDLDSELNDDYQPKTNKMCHLKYQSENSKHSNTQKCTNDPPYLSQKDPKSKHET